MIENYQSEISSNWNQIYSADYLDDFQVNLSKVT